MPSGYFRCRFQVPFLFRGYVRRPILSSAYFGARLLAMSAVSAAVVVAGGATSRVFPARDSGGCGRTVAWQRLRPPPPPPPPPSSPAAPAPAARCLPPSEFWHWESAAAAVASGEHRRGSDGAQENTEGAAAVPPPFVCVCVCVCVHLPLAGLTAVSLCSPWCVVESTVHVKTAPPPPPPSPPPPPVTGQVVCGAEANTAHCASVGARAAPLIVSCG